MLDPYAKHLGWSGGKHRKNTDLGLYNRIGRDRERDPSVLIVSPVVTRRSDSPSHHPWDSPSHASHASNQGLEEDCRSRPSKSGRPTDVPSEHLDRPAGHRVRLGRGHHVEDGFDLQGLHATTSDLRVFVAKQPWLLLKN